MALALSQISQDAQSSGFPDPVSSRLVYRQQPAIEALADLPVPTALHQSAKPLPR
jgi:hypothetical protein